MCSDEFSLKRALRHRVARKIVDENLQV